MTTTAIRPSGYTSPVSEEVTLSDLRVEGTLPPELCGDYIRNGPNARPGEQGPHPFFEDGMLHGIRLEDGRARAYRNRWVRTRAFTENARMRRPDGTLDLTVGQANTNIVDHGGKLLALVESSFPAEVTRELRTIGPYDFAGRLNVPFTAHPHVCPRTGEMLAFGISHFPASLTYLRIDAAGNLIESRPVPVKGSTMMHDFAFTDRYAVFMDLPIRFDIARAMSGQMPFVWDPSYGARLGVIERNDPSVPVRWLPVDPCYVFHVANAYDDGDRIVLDVSHYRELWVHGANAFEPSTFRRWTIDLTRGAVTETELDEREMEFPRIDERIFGDRHRYVYAVADGSASGGPKVLRKYDVRAGTTTQHDFGAGRFPGEAVFVPGGAGEDAGWLMCYVYDANTDRSEFAVLDASDIAAAPVARVPLPVRIPRGFHGNWIADHAN